MPLKGFVPLFEHSLDAVEGLDQRIVATLEEFDDATLEKPTIVIFTVDIPSEIFKGVTPRSFGIYLITVDDKGERSVTCQRIPKEGGEEAYQAARESLVITLKACGKTFSEHHFSSHPQFVE